MTTMETEKKLLGASKKGVVLLSGGLDSTLCATMAVKDLGADNVIALTILYGQKHERELIAAKKVAIALIIQHKTLVIPGIFAGFRSSLIDKDVPIPKMSYEEMEKACGISPTYIPYRNGVLLSYAAVIALVGGARFIYFGAHAEDARSCAYPDTTPEFIGSMANAIYVGTYHKVRLLTPLQWYTKKEIVVKSIELSSPYQFTWSCYARGEVHCGKCPTCISRRQAFKDSGYADPTEYAEEVNNETISN